MDGKVVHFLEPFHAVLGCEDTPRPRDNEILCKALYSVISVGSETISFRKQFDAAMHRTSELGWSSRAGYSMAAEVIEAGKDVKGFKVGDVVYAHAQHRQYFTIDPSALAFVKPDYIRSDEVCWITIMRAGLFAAQKCQIKVTDSVVIMGLGIFGMAAMQWAKVMGARRVIAVDPIARRVERAKQFGATHALTGEAAELIDQIIDININE